MVTPSRPPRPLPRSRRRTCRLQRHGVGDRRAARCCRRPSRCRQSRRSSADPRQSRTHWNQRHLLGNAPGAAAHGARDVGAMAIAVGGAPAVRDRGVARQDATAEIDVIGPDAGVDDEGGDVACPQPVAVLRIQRPVSLIDAIESQVAWLCAVRSAASDTVWSCSMACTFGLLLSRATAASGRVAAKPLIAAV